MDLGEQVLFREGRDVAANGELTDAEQRGELAHPDRAVPAQFVHQALLPLRAEQAVCGHRIHLLCESERFGLFLNDRNGNRLPTAFDRAGSMIGLVAMGEQARRWCRVGSLTLLPSATPSSGRTVFSR